MAGRKKNRGRLERRARRESRLFLQPQIRGIEREGERAEDEYNRATGALQSTYGGYLDELPKIGAGYTRDIGRINEQLAGMMSPYAEMMTVRDAEGGVIPELAQESQAGANYYGSIGQSAAGLLSSLSARQAGYESSAAREGALARRYGLETLESRYGDVQDMLRSEMLGVRDTMPSMIQQRLDELRDERMKQQLLRSQMAGDEAFSQFLQSQIGGILKNERRNTRRRPRGRTGGANPRSSPGTRKKPREGVRGGRT